MAVTPLLNTKQIVVLTGFIEDNSEIQPCSFNDSEATGFIVYRKAYHVPDNLSLFNILDKGAFDTRDQAYAYANFLAGIQFDIQIE